jgi:two-component system chemotaxis response regulator CheB
MDKIKILIVDDSALYRRILRDVVESLEDAEFLDIAPNGRIALEKMKKQAPDLVTLDVEMPEMNGLQTLQEIRRLYPDTGVVMISSLTTRDAEITLQALEIGAFDFIAKPNDIDLQNNFNLLSHRLKNILSAYQIRHRFTALRRKPGSVTPIEQPPVVQTAAPPKSLLSPGKPEILAIGISTGGPKALVEMIPALPASFPVPVVIVQHMPATFTQALAESLNKKANLTVKEGEHGEMLKRGFVYIAPGNRQLRIAGKAGGNMIELTDDPPENHCRPSADYLFRSVARIYKNKSLAVIMTGMGRDGTIGLRLMKREGARVLAQDEESCVVFGMPMEAIKAGVVDKIVSLKDMASEIARSVAL